MSPSTNYQSELFQSLPENSGYLAIYISENSCDIAISSSTFVLCYLARYQKPEETDQHQFIVDIFSSLQSLFARRFQEVNIGLNHQDFLIYPTNQFANADQALSLLIDSDGKKIFHNASPIKDSKLNYGVDEQLVQLFDQSFEAYRIVHCASYVADIAMNEQSDGLILLDQNYFDLVMKKNGSIHSINRHYFESKEDITYYTLLACKDAEIAANKCKIIISGVCDKNDTKHQYLKEFLFDVQLKPLNKNISIRPDFDQPEQYSCYVLNLLHANY